MKVAVSLINDITNVVKEVVKGVESLGRGAIMILVRMMMRDLQGQAFEVKASIHMKSRAG